MTELNNRNAKISGNLYYCANCINFNSARSSSSAICKMCSTSLTEITYEEVVNFELKAKEFCKIIESYRLSEILQTKDVCKDLIKIYILFNLFLSKYYALIDICTLQFEMNVLTALINEKNDSDQVSLSRFLLCLRNTMPIRYLKRYPPLQVISLIKSK